MKYPSKLNGLWNLLKAFLSHIRNSLLSSWSFQSYLCSCIWFSSLMLWWCGFQVCVRQLFCVLPGEHWVLITFYIVGSRKVFQIPSAASFISFSTLLQLFLLLTVVPGFGSLICWTCPANLIGDWSTLCQAYKV